MTVKHKTTKQDKTPLHSSSCSMFLYPDPTKFHLKVTMMEMTAVGGARAVPGLVDERGSWTRVLPGTGLRMAPSLPLE